MKPKMIKLADKTQHIFITAERIDEQMVRLDIYDGDNDSSIDVIVERSALLNWCNSLVNGFS